MAASRIDPLVDGVALRTPPVVECPQGRDPIGSCAVVAHPVSADAENLRAAVRRNALAGGWSIEPRPSSVAGLPKERYRRDDVCAEVWASPAPHIIVFYCDDP